MLPVLMSYWLKKVPTLKNLEHCGLTFDSAGLSDMLTTTAQALNNFISQLTTTATLM